MAQSIRSAPLPSFYNKENSRIVLSTMARGHRRLGRSDCRAGFALGSATRGGAFRSSVSSERAISFKLAQDCAGARRRPDQRLERLDPAHRASLTFQLGRLSSFLLAILLVENQMASLWANTSRRSPCLVTLFQVSQGCAVHRYGGHQWIISR
jgi:hypothetical protein